MKIHILGALLCIFLHIPAFASIQTLPDDKVDSAPEVAAINNNFRLLHVGKLDLRPGDIIPRTNNTYTLGNTNFRWAELHTTSATVYSALSVGDVGYSGLFNAGNSNGGGTNSMFLRNTGSATGSTARIMSFVNGASAGHPLFGVSNNVNEWYWGMDNYDGDKWKLAYNNVPGSGTDRITVDSTGNVGIATGTPQAKLQVAGSAMVDTLQVATTTLPAGFVVSIAGALYIINPSANAGITFSTRTSLTNGNWRLATIIGNGNIALIDQINDRSVLTVYGSTNTRRLELFTTTANDADVELEVSNGASVGGGSIHRASSGTHSKRALKHSINYYGPLDYKAAYDDLKTLRHVTFKYKSRQNGVLINDPLAAVHKGLIYEESPDRIKDGNGAIVIDDRIEMLEMALIEAIKKIEELEEKLK